MKKILISLFSLILISGLTMNATACKTCGCQKDAKKECTGNLETSLEDNTTKACEKSKKECCKSKKKSSCEKSNKKSSCSKSNESGFNFNKSNNYSGKSSCSKSTAKKCCKKKEAVKENEEASIEENEDKKEE